MAENNKSSSSGKSGSSNGREIKTRNSMKEAPVVNKVPEAAELAGRAAVRTRQTTQNLLDESHDSETNYATDRAGEGARRTANDTKEAARHAKNKTEEKVRNQIEKRLQRKMEGKESGNASSRTVEQGRIRTRDQAAKNIKTRSSAKQGSVKVTAKSSGNATVKTMGHSVKGAERSIKTAESTAKAAVKTSKAAAKATKEGAQAAAKASEKAAVAAKNAAVATAKAAAAAAKAIIAAAKAAGAALWKFAAAAGAAIVGAAPVIVLGSVILAVAVLCTGDTHRDFSGNDTSSVINEINTEWLAQLDEIKSGFEDVTMEGGRATWPQVFSLYTAQSADTSIDSWDEGHALRMIFWDMNWIHYDIYAVAEAETAPEVDQKVLMRSVDAVFLISGADQIYRQETEVYQNKEKLEDIAKKYPGRKIHSAITVTIRHKSVEEMMEKLGFTDSQMEHAQALLEKEFAQFWQQRLYGVNGADDDIVNVAITQLGNSGGWPYWEYAGFSSRVEWCACFVSWCAGQCGYVDKGLFINTGSPPLQVQFFRDKGQWMDGSGTPAPGMIIFFDWYNADFADHVGIVEKVEDGYVYTIEGNSGDAVNRGTWVLGDSQILGYGWIVE